MRRKVLITAAVAFAATPLLWPSGASAVLLYEASINGGAFTTVCTAPSGTTCSGTHTIGGVTFTAGSTISGSPGTATLSELSSNVVNITEGAASANITLLIGDTGFTLPIAPPPKTLGSAIFTSVVIPGTGANTLSYISCIDQADGQNVCPGTISTIPVTPSITSSGSSTASDSVAVTTLTAPYSMTEELTMTLSAGTVISYAATTLLAPAPAPEPASLALLGTALAGLGVFARRRRRSMRAAAAEIPRSWPTST